VPVYGKRRKALRFPRSLTEEAWEGVIKTAQECAGYSVSKVAVKAEILRLWTRMTADKICLVR
jgi:hypothetical protein